MAKLACRLVPSYQIGLGLMAQSYPNPVTLARVRWYNLKFTIRVFRGEGNHNTGKRPNLSETLVVFGFRVLQFQEKRMKVKILQWHAVAAWTWDAQDETCGICRMAFDGCCPDCKLPGDDCPLIWGACNHAFHLHCILKWVNSQTSQAHCPMCRREWQFKG
ncbi:anaphase-promoting complex subunit 11 [Rosa sericea]